jgi:hypothetical protein
MTQHYYPTEHQGKPATIMMGWDRPLQGFFMVIEDSQNRGEYIYSNLDDPELIQFGGLPPCLDHFLAKLQALGLSVPDVMLNAIELDAALNEGNRRAEYNRDGSVKPQQNKSASR